MWPIGVVTAHGILLGITVCFALFPVFGRARQLDQPPLSDFGKHVEAFGELLESTRDEPYAVARLRHYQEHVRRDANASRRQGT